MDKIKQILKSESITDDELKELLDQLVKLINCSSTSNKPSTSSKLHKKILTDMEISEKKLISPIGGCVEQGVKKGNEYLTYFYKAFKRLPKDIIEFRRFVLEHC